MDSSTLWNHRKQVCRQTSQTSIWMSTTPSQSVTSRGKFNTASNLCQRRCFVVHGMDVEMTEKTTDPHPMSSSSAFSFFMLLEFRSWCLLLPRTPQSEAGCLFRPKVFVPLPDGFTDTVICWTFCSTCSGVWCCVTVELRCCYHFEFIEMCT